MTYIDEITSANLQLNNGIYFTENMSSVSYPEEDNSICFQIEDGSFWFNHRNNVIASMVQKYSATATNLVDIGGGNGYVSARLKNSIPHTIMVEPGKAGALNAQLRQVPHIVCGLLHDCKFNTGIFDAAGMFDVVEHLPNPAEVLQETARILKPGGHLYITVPAFAWLWSKEDTLAGHFTRYTQHSMQSLLQSCNFKIVHSTYFFQFLVVPILLLRTLPSAIGIYSWLHGSNRYKQQHGNSTGNLMQRLCTKEFAKINAGRIIGSGSSLMVVASKV